MARQNSEGEFNTFVKGIITEAGPLTFPENSSINEDNMVLNKDGSRRRRLGLDFESGYKEQAISGALLGSGPTSSTFSWKGAGNFASFEILVGQIGAQLTFFDTSVTPLSDGFLANRILTEAQPDDEVSFASVDGRLVAASGNRVLDVFEVDVNKAITQTQITLTIRDLFGVEDIDGTTDLLEGNDVTVRPVVETGWGSTEGGVHVYNLRNQTWGPPQPKSSLVTSASTPFSNDLTDPIRIFIIAGQDQGGLPTFPTDPGILPSNADNMTEFLFAQTDYPSPGSKTLDRFHGVDSYANKPESSRTPVGFFVIDALERGPSRLEAYADLIDRHNNPDLLPPFQTLSFPISVLPVDTTSGGASVLASYAGRVFYAGFKGEVTGGDSQSPDLSSFVMFSQLVDSRSKVSKCYQDGDPTSKESPDLLDTDGGFIKIDGAYGIQSLIVVGKSLLVLATNGLWSIQGGSDFGFTATGYRVDKVSDHGTVGRKTQVLVDNTVLYWGEDSIYQVSVNEIGEFTSGSISETTIQTLYDAIPSQHKLGCKGSYDSFDNKVKWLYGPGIGEDGERKELILDTVLQAFYTSTIAPIANGFPAVIDYVEVPPFSLGTSQEAVTSEGFIVTASGETVTSGVVRRQSATRNTKYMTVTSYSPFKYTFSAYTDSTFKDWVTHDGTGIDAPASLLTGWAGDGDFKKFKQVPYLYMHFFKTETGFTLDGGGDFVPTNSSSCVMQVQWDWANDASSGKWGPTFQAYRHRRLYTPTDISDTFDNGELTVISKNKLRGKGRVFSLSITTEPDKDLHILGWSVSMSGNANV